MKVENLKENRMYVYTNGIYRRRLWYLECEDGKYLFAPVDKKNRLSGCMEKLSEVEIINHVEEEV